MLCLFQDQLKLESFYGEFIRQALEALVLFCVLRPLTHKGKVSGVSSEPLQSWPEILHVVPAQILNSSSAQTITCLLGSRMSQLRK